MYFSFKPFSISLLFALWGESVIREMQISLNFSMGLIPMLVSRAVIVLVVLVTFQFSLLFLSIASATPTQLHRCISRCTFSLSLLIQTLACLSNQIEIQFPQFRVVCRENIEKRQQFSRECAGPLHIGIVFEIYSNMTWELAISLKYYKIFVATHTAEKHWHLPPLSAVWY